MANFLKFVLLAAFAGKRLLFRIPTAMYLPTDSILLNLLLPTQHSLWSEVTMLPLVP